MKRWLVVILLGICSLGYSQPQKVLNYPKFDKKWINFGFMLGANMTQVKVTPRIDAYTNYDLISIQNIPQPGAAVGVLTTVKLGLPIFRLRFIPTISFQEALFRYKFVKFGGTLENPYINEERVGHVNIDLPLLLQFRTKRYNNFAAYALTGMQYSLDLQSQEKATQSDLDPFLKFKKHDFQYQVGGGVEFFFPFFKMGLEIKMSQALKSIFINDNTYISSPIDRMIQRTWWFSIIFEG